MQDAIDAGTYEPSDALTFAKYADQPNVFDVVLADNYRSGADLDWRLERAAQRLEADRAYADTWPSCHDAGWRTYEGHQPEQTHRGAKRLSQLGIDGDDHAGEPCHLVVLRRSYDGAPDVSPWCTEPKRHRATGISTVKATAATGTVESDRARQAREQAKATKAVAAHRNAFARQAIEAKLRSRDVLDLVLPVLFDTAGQTELNDAARLLGCDAVEDRFGGKDYVTPLQQWAAASTANLTRAMLAVAYCLAVTHGDFRETARTALTGWLDGLGYQPEP